MAHIHAGYWWLWRWEEGGAACCPVVAPDDRMDPVGSSPEGDEVLPSALSDGSVPGTSEIIKSTLHVN